MSDEKKRDLSSSRTSTHAASHATLMRASPLERFKRLNQKPSHARSSNKKTTTATSNSKKRKKKTRSLHRLPSSEKGKKAKKKKNKKQNSKQLNRNVHTQSAPVLGSVGGLTIAERLSRLYADMIEIIDL